MSSLRDVEAGYIANTRQTPGIMRLSAAPAGASTTGAAASTAGVATGPPKPCSSKSATTRCTSSSWFNCKSGSGIVKMSPVFGCS